MSRRGEWGEMAAVIPDEMVDEVAVVAPIDELGAAIRARYGDRVQRVGYYALDGGASWSPEEWSHLIATHPRLSRLDQRGRMADRRSRFVRNCRHHRPNGRHR